MFVRCAVGSAIIAMSAGSLSFGAILLPEDAVSLRLDGRGAFGTTNDPYIDVTTGQLANVSSGPTTILGVGKIQTIYDQNSNTIGSFDGQITGVLQGTLGANPLISFVDQGSSVLYSITSFIDDVSVVFYYDVDSDALVIPDLFGTSIAVPAEAVTGDVWLDLEGSATSSITIRFNRSNGGDFDSFEILSQTFNASGLQVVDGSFADQVVGNPDLLAGQLGTFVSSFGTIEIDGVTVNAPVGAFIESSFNFTLTIPEPASLSFIALGGLTLLRRRTS